MIELKDVTKDNYLECINLELLQEQFDNLASNAITIAQSKFELSYRLRAIYSDNKIIGMLAFCHEDVPKDLELYWLFRFMLDRNHQGKGIAAQVLNLLITEIKVLGGKRLQTMHKTSNKYANSAYRKFGFMEIGTLEDGDIHLEICIK